MGGRNESLKKARLVLSKANERGSLDRAIKAWNKNSVIQIVGRPERVLPPWGKLAYNTLCTRCGASGTQRLCHIERFAAVGRCPSCKNKPVVVDGEAMRLRDAADFLSITPAELASYSRRNGLTSQEAFDALVKNPSLAQTSMELGIRRIVNGLQLLKERVGKNQSTVIHLWVCSSCHKKMKLSMCGALRRGCPDCGIEVRMSQDHPVTVNEVPLTFEDVEELYGVSKAKLSRRLAYGWTLEEALGVQRRTSAPFKKRVEE